MIKTIKNKIYKLLRKSEKWTKTDMVYLAKGGSWITLGKIVSTFTGLTLAVIYANFLTKEEYATYKYLLSIAGFFAIITLPGLETSLTKSIARGFEGSLYKAIKERLKWSFFGSFIAIFISIYYYHKTNTTLSIGFLIIAFTAPITNSINIGPFLQGKKLWKYSTQLNIIKNIITFLAIASVVLLYPKALPVLFVTYISTALLQIIFYFHSIKKYKPNKKEDNKCIPFGKHLSLMSVIGIIAEHIDKILIWKFLGSTELAIYSFATIPVMHIQNFLKSTSILAFPKIAQQEIKIIKKTLPNKLLKFFFLLTPIIISYIILIPFIFNLLFPNYSESIIYTRLLILNILFFPQRLLSHSIVSTNKINYLYILKIINPLSKIILFIVLIPIFNIYGAIASMLISSAFSFTTLNYFFRKI